MDEQTSPHPIPTAPTAAGAPGSRPALRDRVLGWRGVVGVALASVILGGAGGAVLGAVSNGGDSGGPGGFGGFRGPGMMQSSQNQPNQNQQNQNQQLPDGLPGNQGQTPPTGTPGQLPPSTAPQQEEQNS